MNSRYMHGDPTCFRTQACLTLSVGSAPEKEKGLIEYLFNFGKGPDDVVGHGIGAG